MADTKAPLQEKQFSEAAGALKGDGNKVFDNLSRVIEPDMRRESRLCRRILNKRTGREFFRNPEDPKQNWDILYKHCKQRSYEFELEMDDEFKTGEDHELITKDGQVIYQEGELLGLNIQQLREIAQTFGFTGRSKSELVAGILKAQRG